MTRSIYIGDTLMHLLVKNVIPVVSLRKVAVRLIDCHSASAKLQI